MRALHVYVGVNAHTDPQLAALARAGDLHRFEQHALALPFVFHDPAEQVFLLVVPEVLAHREIPERAALLGELSSEDVAIPRYVADVATVVGTRGLVEALERGGEARRISELERRESELEEAREDLRIQSDVLLEREAAQRGEDARVEVLARELDLREEELELRLERLREREVALSVRPDEDDWEAVEEPVFELANAVELVEEGDVDFIEDMDELANLRDATQVIEEDGVVFDEVETIDADALDAVVLDDGASRDDTSVRRNALAEDGAIRPPASLFDDPHVEAVAAHQDGAWLFVRLQEGHEEVFAEAEVLIQYLAVDETPIILLSLTDWDEARPYVRRAALDPRDAADRALLDGLCESPVLTAALFSPRGKLERTLTVSVADRRSTLISALDRADRAKGRLELSVAMERALAAPPPVKLGGHPFGDAPPAEDAGVAYEAVQSLSKWSQPAKLDLALFALSIPRETVDESFRRVLGDAIRHGIALPSPLVRRAVSLGVAAEPGALVSRTIDAFRETARMGETCGLRAGQIAKNWSSLLALADENEVALEADAHEEAHAAIAATEGRSSRPPVSLDALPSLSSDELERLLDRPKARLAAALELASRGDPDVLATVARAVRKMPRDEVLQVVPRLLAHGEACADALIDGLRAKKTFVRQASALGLGELGLRRGINPLLQLLQTEPTDVWEEVGRVLSAFGSAPLRTLARAMKSPKGPESRFSYTVAHLLEAGEDVRELQSHDDEGVRRLALSASSHRENARKHREIVAGSMDAGDDGVRAFTLAFLSALPSPGSASGAPRPRPEA